MNKDEARQAKDEGKSEPPIGIFPTGRAYLVLAVNRATEHS
jgi:hypothetical protein